MSSCWVSSVAADSRDSTRSNGHRRRHFARCIISGIGALILLLASMSRDFASDSDALYAPELTGDGQTAGWRIINEHEAGKKPWTAIGNFLNPELGGYCSAVLVAPRIVMTANHCLYAAEYRILDDSGNPTKQLMDPKRFVFVAGLHDNAYADIIPVEDVVMGGWAPGSNDTSKDWLIVVLKRPASAEITPIPIRPYKPEEVAAAWSRKLVVAAYPGQSFAFSSVLRFSLNCSLLKSGSANIVSHDCPAEGGSSGAPILVEEEGELRLVGLHTSTGWADSRQKNGVSINSFAAPLKEAIERFN